MGLIIPDWYIKHLCRYSTLIGKAFEDVINSSPQIKNFAMPGAPISDNNKEKMINLLMSLNLIAKLYGIKQSDIDVEIAKKANKCNFSEVI